MLLPAVVVTAAAKGIAFLMRVGMSLSATVPFLEGGFLFTAVSFMGMAVNMFFRIVIAVGADFFVMVLVTPPAARSFHRDLPFYFVGCSDR